MTERIMISNDREFTLRDMMAVTTSVYMLRMALSKANEAGVEFPAKFRLKAEVSRLERVLALAKESLEISSSKENHIG